jgi:hypothetical protein
MKSELIDNFFHSSQAAVVRGMDHYFGWNAFTLKDLFMETRRRVLQHVADSLFSRYENAWRQIYLDHQKLMHYLQSTQAKIPRSFLAASEQVLNYDLRNQIPFLPDRQAFDRIVQILQESERWGIELEKENLEAQMRSLLEEHLQGLAEGEMTSLEEIHLLLDIAYQARLKMNLWESQNLFHQFVQTRLRDKKAAAPGAAEKESIARLAERLSYHLEE